MKKQPGRVRWTRFEGECFVSSTDLSDMLSKVKDPAASCIAEYLNEITLSCMNAVEGMADDKKQAWQDIMKPN